MQVVISTSSDVSGENPLITVMDQFYHLIHRIKGKLYKFIFLKYITAVWMLLRYSILKIKYLVFVGIKNMKN